MTSFLRRLLGRRDVPVDMRIARTVFRTTAALYADYAQASTAFANARVAFDSAPAEAFDIASGAYEAAERATVDACDGPVHTRQLNGQRLMLATVCVGSTGPRWEPPSHMESFKTVANSTPPSGVELTVLSLSRVRKLTYVR